MAYNIPLSVPIFVGITLSIEKFPTTCLEMKDIAYVPYSSSIGSLMYYMLCTRLDIAKMVGVLVNLVNPRCEH